MSKQDIEAALGYEYYTKVEQATCSGYSSWVETMILTSGKDRLVENTLGLVGEAGEFAEKVKKMIRDGNPDTEYIYTELAKKELGDVLFYLTALANYFGSSLQEVLEQNIVKLNDRKNRGVLQGSGDNR